MSEDFDKSFLSPQFSQLAVINFALDHHDLALALRRVHLYCGRFALHGEKLKDLGELPFGEGSLFLLLFFEQVQKLLEIEGFLEIADGSFSHDFVLYVL